MEAAEDRASCRCSGHRGGTPPPGVQERKEPCANLLSALPAGLLASAAAPAPNSRPAHAKYIEKQLGTQWGEGVASPVTSVAYVTSIGTAGRSPPGVLQREDASMACPPSDCPWPGGGGLPPYSRQGMAAVRPRAAPQHPAIYRVVRGQRYRLWLNNLLAAPRPTVVAGRQPGRHVLNGQPGSLKNRGYVLEPGGEAW
ncbi:hypothetical protein ACPA9J_31615 [Pseudomonas aeruginosa]